MLFDIHKKQGVKRRKREVEVPDTTPLNKPKHSSSATEEASTSVLEQIRSLADDPDTNHICNIIGEYMHQVPKADSTCRMILGLKGDDPNYVTHMGSYHKLSHAAKEAYDSGKVACAVVRKLLVYGRGNVKQDVIKSNGNSAAALKQKRDGFNEPTFEFADANGDTCQININGKAIDALTATELSALRAIYSKAGNCGEHADMAYAFLKSQPLPAGTQIFRCSNKKEDHAFLIIAVPNGDNTTTLLICDPWINFVGTENIAKTKKEITDLVSFDIYKPALDLVKECCKAGTTSRETIEKTAKGKPCCTVSQPKVDIDIFTLPAEPATVGTTKPAFATGSIQLAATAASAAAKAAKPDHGYYDMPSLVFNTGDDAEIPLPRNLTL